MVSRIWHGWTTLENADTYESLLKTEIFKEIESKNVGGFKEIQLFRRVHTDEVEFITIMWFDTIKSVKQFAGEDYETAFVPESARKVLKRFDTKSQHYETRHRLTY